MERATLYTWLAVLADGLAGLTGGLLSEQWLRRHLAVFVGFAAGALLTAVFLELLPEAVASEGPSAFHWAFASFMVLAVAEWLMGHHHHDSHGSQSRTLPPALLTSDALHNVGDGAAVAAAFLVSPKAGIATALAIIAHELPQEVGDYALLRAAGFSRARALTALSLVQLSAALGAAAVMLGSHLVQNLEGIVLAIASGTFLYIGATDLLPEMRTATPSEGRGQWLGVLGGLVLVGGVSLAEHLLGLKN
ncbi:ZIP family metal transporter [Hyalangium versicolor]|uniref:ZIP family metal transporter n=1 Tax=Hyalangium versicolor TaxID=2861190 RepID=UPI001CCA4C11|nr:ZIP family metal transporter [Hyalangium versicolor]